MRGVRNDVRLVPSSLAALRPSTMDLTEAWEPFILKLPLHVSWARCERCEVWSRSSELLIPKTIARGS